MKRNLKYLTLAGILALGIGVYGGKFIEQKGSEFYYQVEKSIGYAINGVLNGGFDSIRLEKQKFEEKKKFLDEYEERMNRERYWNVG